MDTRINSIPIVIHVGLHKTASTFLQRYFFPRALRQTTYIDLRKSLPELLRYILYCHDFDWKTEKAIRLFLDGANGLGVGASQQILISDEQLCGSPWEDANRRKQLFDRLHVLFPHARYLLVLRNQPDMVQSLYLQYIKTGGSASTEQFLRYKRHPLAFGLKSYLNYGSYLEYIASKVPREQVGIFLYEHMQADGMDFLKRIADFVEPNENHRIDESLVGRRANKSLSPLPAQCLLAMNRFFKSERQPFLALPARWRQLALRVLVYLSTSKRGNMLRDRDVKEFCYSAMVGNCSIRKFCCGENLPETYLIDCKTVAQREGRCGS